MQRYGKRFYRPTALFALSRMRNGVMVALSELPLPTMSEMTVIGVLGACAAYAITYRLSRSAEG